MRKIILFFCFGTLSALPQSPIVIDGAATFVHSTEAKLQISASGHAIIDWAQFSIDQNEPAESIQPSARTSVFTARQSQNSILGLLNGRSFTAGPIFSDTNQERWCVYYPDPILGVPFTIFYKECLGAILSQQVGPIISQFLVDLHPYDEFLPGWIENFSISDGYEDPFSPECYFLRRRQIKVVNHPKTIIGL